MPICEADPWRLQYFAQVEVSADVNIPTEDSDAWQWYPGHRWVYDKLAVALSQGLEAGPHGTRRRAFRCSPSRSSISRAWASAAACCTRAPNTKSTTRPAISGCRCSTAAMSAPMSPWSTASRAGGGMSPASRPAGARSITGPCRRRPTPRSKRIAAPGSRDISPAIPACSTSRPSAARIIEAHLRFADQWPDLYGAGWVEALVRLYDRGDWDFTDDDRRDGYSVVLFGPTRAALPPSAAGAGRRGASECPACRSVQITFHEDSDPSGTPCRRAASGLPLSTASISPAGSPRANGSGSIFCRPDAATASAEHCASRILLRPIRAAHRVASQLHDIEETTLMKIVGFEGRADCGSASSRAIR